jgi:transcriptional regulator with XRE-family HTH domain
MTGRRRWWRSSLDGIHEGRGEVGSIAVPIGKRLRELREQRNLTGKALSLRAGLPWSYVARLECGEIRDPRVSTCRKLAKALKVTVADLIEEGKPAQKRARRR